MSSKRFEGVCYDGPWEGREYSSEWSSFKVSVTPPLGVIRNWHEYDPVMYADIRYGIYQWSYPLRKWVWRFEGRIGRAA